MTTETETPETQPDAQLVPVTEAIRYRKRAQAAEQQLAALTERIGQLESQVAEAQQTTAMLERRERIDALLRDADAVDLGVARLLTEAAIEGMDEPDMQLAIGELRRGKPYLFRTKRRSESSAMSARPIDPPDDPTANAAQQAVTTGDRRDLLRYLRLRRKNA